MKFRSQVLYFLLLLRLASYYYFFFLIYFTTMQAQPEQGKVIGVGVHIYIICLWTKKKLKRTLAIDSPFQTFMIGLLIEFID